MDRSKLQALVADHLPKLVIFLGLEDWKVYPKFERLEGNAVAQCRSDIDYKTAMIVIDMDHISEDELVLDILFHELAHVIQWPFYLYQQMVAQMIPDITDGQTNGMVENRAWRHALESNAILLENLWRGHLKAAYLDKYTAPSLEARS